MLELSKNEYTELRYKDAVISIIKDGCYSVAGLLSGNETKTKFKLFLSNISTLFKVRSDSSSEAGIRAANPEKCTE